jgi:hypothetical protein
MAQEQPSSSPQSKEAVEPTGSGDLPARSFLGRFVKVVVLRDEGKLTELRLCTCDSGDLRTLLSLILGINPGAIFADIARELHAKGHPEAILLQETSGPMPYWSESDPGSLISDITRTVCALEIGTGQPYLLAMVRTAPCDYPVAIRRSNTHSILHADSLP